MYNLYLFSLSLILFIYRKTDNKTAKWYCWIKLNKHMNVKKNIYTVYFANIACLLKIFLKWLKFISRKVVGCCYCWNSHHSCFLIRFQFYKIILHKDMNKRRFRISVYQNYLLHIFTDILYHLTWLNPLWER
jgi:hypothetical protein